MLQIKKLENTVDLRSNEIISLLGHVIDDVSWLPIFSDHSGTITSFTKRCMRDGCAHEFTLVPYEFGRFELLCLSDRQYHFGSKSTNRLTYHIADITSDAIENETRQVKLFNTEPVTWLNERLDKPTMFRSLSDSERIEWVVCSHLKVLI